MTEHAPLFAFFSFNGIAFEKLGEFCQIVARDRANTAKRLFVFGRLIVFGEPAKIPTVARKLLFERDFARRIEDRNSRRGCNVRPARPPMRAARRVRFPSPSIKKRARAKFCPRNRRASRTPRGGTRPARSTAARPLSPRSAAVFFPILPETVSSLFPLFMICL